MAKQKKSAYFVGNAGLDFGVNKENTSSKSGVKDNQKPSKGKERKKTEEDLEFERLFGNWKEGQKYNEEQLDFFKDILLNNKEIALENITAKKEGIVPAGSLTGDDRMYQAIQNERLQNEIVRLNKFVRDINHALNRIKTGNYGVCKISGKMISPQRLFVVPHATCRVEYK